MILIIVICLLMEKKIKFKAGNKNFNLPTQFFLGSISTGFSNTESREVSFNGNTYDFSADYNSNDKSDILTYSQVLIVLLSFSQSLTRYRTKCLSLNDEPCMVLINLNPVELEYYPSIISLGKCSGRFNVLSRKICFLKNNDLNIKALNMITNKK